MCCVMDRVYCTGHCIPTVPHELVLSQTHKVVASLAASAVGNVDFIFEDFRVLKSCFLLSRKWRSTYGEQGGHA